MCDLVRMSDRNIDFTNTNAIDFAIHDANIAEMVASVALAQRPRMADDRLRSSEAAASLLDEDPLE